ncbi:MAG: hypothetical protein JSS83_04640 [Cyanobacteria bacterium SZAS LIN-3]|nr:hypothetical protein [Cyanobacteria bacterium SZAS LIN-3]
MLKQTDLERTATVRHFFASGHSIPMLWLGALASFQVLANSGWTIRGTNILQHLFLTAYLGTALTVLAFTVRTIHAQLGFGIEGSRTLHKRKNFPIAAILFIGLVGCNTNDGMNPRNLDSSWHSLQSDLRLYYARELTMAGKPAYESHCCMGGPPQQNVPEPFFVKISRQNY